MKRLAWGLGLVGGVALTILVAVSAVDARGFHAPYFVPNAGSAGVGNQGATPPPPPPYAEPPRPGAPGGPPLSPGRASGEPAVRPTRPNAGPNEPAITEADVREYVRQVGFAKATTRRTPTILRVEFLPNGRARQQVPDARVDRGDNELVCVAEVEGSFGISHPGGVLEMPDARGFFIFDADTGNLLAERIVPK